MIKTVSLQLTRRCNSRCPHCFGDYSPDSEGELTLDQAKDYIDQLPEHKTHLLNLTGGEPTLYDNLLDVIQYADKIKKQFGYPETIHMVTNGKWDEEPDDYLKELEKSGLNSMDFSIDDFRTKEQNNAALETMDYLISDTSIVVSVNAMEYVIPIRRGYNISKDKWMKRRFERKAGPFKLEDVRECAIDEWSFYLQGEDDRITTAFVSPTGLYLCGGVSEVCKIGELGEPLSVIEPRVKRIGKFIRTLAAFDPSVVAKKMNEHYNYDSDINTEHDCISCHEMFDDLGCNYIDWIIKNGSFEKIVDELMGEIEN